MLACLVVDDSKVVRMVARRVLEGMGLAVDEASDGQQAITACTQSMPGLVLLGWEMLGMSGIDVLRAKTLCMGISGAMAGAGGTFYAQKYLYIDPTIAFGVEKSVEMLLVSMIGGAGTVFGPLVGAVALGFVGEATRALTSAQGLGLVVYGIILVAIVARLPDGLIGLFARRAARRGGRDA